METAPASSLALEISNLSAVPGPSGDEQRVGAYLLEACAALSGGVQTYQDAIGNVYVMLPASDPRGRHAPVILSAHMDEIGFIVTDDQRRTAARIGPLGTWRADALLGQRVVMLDDDGKLLPGCVGMRPVHWQSKKDKQASVTFADLWVDCSVSDRARTGLTGVFSAPAWIEGTRVSGKALDNRAGCVAVLQALRYWATERRRQPVIAIFTVQEEISSHGAQCASHTVREIFPSVSWDSTSPAKCCVVDATFATDDGCSADLDNSRLYGPVDLGRGPVVCPSSYTSQAAMDWLCNGFSRMALGFTTIPYAISTNTDADTFSAVPWLDPILLSYPLRNMHSAVEIVDTRDLDAIVATLVALC